METQNKKILLIEDNVAESIYAQGALMQAGFRNFEVVQDLASGLDKMPQCDGVLSDLFFPVGNISAEQYVQRFLPFYEQHKERRFEKIGKENAVYRALEQCAKVFGLAVPQYVEKMAAMPDTVPCVLKASRDTVYGIRDHEKYERFLGIEKQVREGINLPLGIISSEYAKQYGKPVVIVTSTNHHSDSFEPIGGLIQVPCMDNLVDGRKDWEGGIESLISQFGGKQ